MPGRSDRRNSSAVVANVATGDPTDRKSPASACRIDLQMPGTGGHKLKEELVREGYRIPFIVYTAHGDEEARVWASRAGAVAFLRKPFDTEALRSSVEAALRDREQDEVVKHARAAG